MTTTEPAQATVTSRDGTPIAFCRSGQGSPLLLVHGTTADHSRWGGALPLLEPHVTVFRMDRRGRGQSGDAPGYTLEKEADDVAAVVDAVAAETGTTIDVLGHSYGALCALEAALRTTRIRRLVLYEPDVHASYPPGWLDRMDQLLTEGRREDVLVDVMRDLAGMTTDQIDRSRSDASWPGRVAAAHTVVRECRAEEAYRWQPARFAGLRVPTLLMAGTESPPELARSTASLEAALPTAIPARMAGTGHVAMLTAPELFAATLLGFLRDDSPPVRAVRDAAMARVSPS